MATLEVAGQTPFRSRAKDGVDLKEAIRTNTPLRENNTYIVTKNIDLKGEHLYLPHGCIVEFKGGKIVNGIVSFDSVFIKGTPKFRNSNYEGRIFIESIDDRCFESKDDTQAFKFLMSNAIENGIRCDFYRDYRINMKEASGTHGLISFQGLDSGAELLFHGNTIYNSYPFSSATIKPVITFRNVKDVTFRNCRFHDVDEHNTHHFKESAGCTFIHCYGDSEGINLIDCSQENGDCILRSGVWVHDTKRPDDTPSRGLYNSTIKVNSNNVGYGLALYCGDSLDLDVTVSNPHRGFYCTGVSNSKIRYEGFNPVETKCHILIKDAVCRRIDASGNEVLDMKGCDHLDINAVVEEIQPNESVVLFQSYGSGLKEGADFRFRSDKCHHHDINFTAKMRLFPESGHVIICGFLPDSGAQDESDMYGCMVSGLLIHDILNHGGTVYRYLCNIGKYTEVYAQIKDCGIDDSQRDGKAYNIQVIGNAKGNLNVINSVLGGILVREKNKDFFDLELDQTSVVKSGFNYISDGTNRAFVRLSQK